jgi:hypothetical protein
MSFGESLKRINYGCDCITKDWTNPDYARKFALERVNPTLKAVYGLELTVKKDSWVMRGRGFIEADFSWRVNFPDMER